ncbi:hypothetical protein ACIQH0_13210 [Streptomyces griseus]|uniref:hypothetical protein n=1 Tax=Streptomyces griseus TaxID=1911 RepID=UPI0037F6233B
MHPLTTLVTRLRESRADTHATAAAALFRKASRLYAATDPAHPNANRERYRAHQLAARAERLSAKSYRWRTTTTAP